MGIPYSEASFVAKAGLGDLQVVKLFLEAGVRPDARGECEVPGDPWSATALEKAAENGHAEVVRTLITAGADLKAPETAGYTQGEFALLLAVQGRHAGAAQALLDAGTNPNVQKRGYANVLMEAAGGGGSPGSPEIVRALIRAGADVNAKSVNSDSTALEYAVWNLNPEIVRILIEAGANPHGKHPGGKTLLKWLLDCEKHSDPSVGVAATEIARMLKAAGATK